MDCKIIKIVTIVIILLSSIFLTTIKLVYKGFTYVEWFTILSSFVAAIIGGISTLIAVYFSIKQNERLKFENRKESIEPIIDFTCDKTIYTILKKDKEIQYKVAPNLKFSIFNLSEYPAKNLEVKLTMDWEKFVVNLEQNSIKFKSYEIEDNYVIFRYGENGITVGTNCKKSFYTYELNERYVFKNEKILFNFESQKDIYKGLFNWIVYEYIKVNEKDLSYGSIHLNKQIAVLNLSIQYSNIDNLEYKKEYEIAIEIGYISTNTNLNKVSDIDEFEVLFVLDVKEK